MESPDGTFNALDYAIEARDGGTAHLRYVHSGILADDWADQYDAIDGHTDFYLHTLSEYLEHFNGRPRHLRRPAFSRHRRAEGGGNADAMELLSRRTRHRCDGAAVGDAVHADLGEAGVLDGVIDYRTTAFLGVRTNDSLYRFFGRNQYGGVVGMSAHVFRDGVDAAAAEAALKNWLDSVYE